MAHIALIKTCRAISKPNIWLRLQHFNRYTWARPYPYSIGTCPYSSRAITTTAQKNILELCDFSMTSEELDRTSHQLISECRQAYEIIASVKDEEVNVTTVLKALNNVECKLGTGLAFIRFIRYVSPNASLRDASGNAEKKIEDFIVETSIQQDLFSRIQILHDKMPNLKAEGQRYLEKLLEDGKRNGLHLPEVVRKEVAFLKKRMKELCIQFCKNRSDANKIVEFTDEELDGLSLEFINSLKKSPNTKKRIITLKYPHIIPIMQKCRNPETRKTLNIAINSETMDNNVPILEELITLRHKHANLLGYPNHVAYKAELNHAKTKENIENFLLDLHEKMVPLWKEEMVYLLELKKEECNRLSLPFEGKLNYWDMPYYSNKVKALKFNIDHEKIKEYFPLETVKKATFDIYQKIFVLKFKKVECPKVWYPGVELYSVECAANNELLGYFFLDLFPRDGKYTHFCIKEIQRGCCLDGVRIPSVVAMLCNFTPSISGKPSLLQHDEVITFFHEFGHVMHEICNKREYAYFHQMQMERDFLEVPSQMLENWVWDPIALKMMSSHYLTGDCLPDVMIEALIKSKLANIGYSNIRIITHAMFDHKLHSQLKADTKSLYHDCCVELVGIEPPEGTNFAGQFEHMALDYDAQYYSYLWSEVLSMDMFYSRFRGGNIMNPVVGKEYREKILEQVKPAGDMIREFLGREPMNDAFLISKGLKV